VNEIEKAIKHFENMRDDNFVVLDKFKKDIESGKVNGITLVYDNRHLYYSLAIAALREKAEREKGCEFCRSLCRFCNVDSLDICDECKNHSKFEPIEHKRFCPNCGRKLEESK
jgi:hypothetical protein